jgi:hypothetical protein
MRGGKGALVVLQVLPMRLSPPLPLLLMLMCALSHRRAHTHRHMLARTQKHTGARAHMRESALAHPPPQPSPAQPPTLCDVHYQHHHINDPGTWDRVDGQI